MKGLTFYKYQGAGNDFILVDQRTRQTIGASDQEGIARLCHRRFGIGADGLILLQSVADYDFEMLYFNADGRMGSLCGNGARCVVAFAHFLGCIQDTCRFLASDGPHEAEVVRPDWIEVHMRDVHTWVDGADFFTVNTGSPHFVRFIPDLSECDVFQEGRRIRYAPEYMETGINVNFAEEITDGGLRVGTYERGVEDETLACGTGVTAAALAYVHKKSNPIGDWNIPIEAKGGQLQVRFQYDGTTFRNIWLCGPATQVFEGIITS